VIAPEWSHGKNDYPPFPEASLISPRFYCGPNCLSCFQSNPLPFFFLISNTCVDPFSSRFHFKRPQRLRLPIAPLLAKLFVPKNTLAFRTSLPEFHGDVINLSSALSYSLHFEDSSSPTPFAPPRPFPLLYKESLVVISLCSFPYLLLFVPCPVPLGNVL